MNTSETKNDRDTLPASPARKILIAVVVVALLMAGIYGWGQYHSRQQLTAQQTDYEQRITAVQAQLQASQADLIATRNRSQLLLARTDLYRTAADLDQRNFGTANTRLQEAAAALEKFKSPAGDPNGEKIAALRSAIAELNINVAANLETQRSQVLEFASQLDRLTLAAPEAAAAN